MKRRLVAILIASTVPLAAAAQDVQQLIEQRRAADKTVWSQETIAQHFEETFIQLWDDLRAATDKLKVFEQFKLNTLIVSNSARWQRVFDDVQKSIVDQTPRRLNRAEYLDLIKMLRDKQYRVVQTEWHHGDFQLQPNGDANSTFNVSIDAIGPEETRYQIRGPISVKWTKRRDQNGHVIPDRIDATALSVTRNSAKPAFVQSKLTQIQMGAAHEEIIAWDWNGDGASDLLYPGANQLLINDGKGRFEAQTLCDAPMTNVIESAVADMNGDGRADLIVIAPPKPQIPPSVFLYQADADGRLTGQPRRIVAPNVSLLVPYGMTIGDIDGDGDLDLFVPQYKAPYLRGQFPTPYYDANDGFAAYLLVNRGDGTLEDATEKAGLAPKRFRRTYRSSFVDMDGDGDLDLLVVSDFAGIDIYHNDGQGGFTDVTSQAVDSPSNFGMSHVFADFNGDGQLDFYVTGMSSTTARRLERMGLRPKDKQTHTKMRMALGYGNRMYLFQQPGHYVEPAFRDTVARSGWAWGAASLDYNNDGRVDLYICNGHMSGKSAKDYCTRFWCHDIYDSTSKISNLQVQLYKDQKIELDTNQMSWNGFEHNRLFANLGERGFENVNFLEDVALEQDCRAALADDFDLDGRVDLLTVTLKISTTEQNKIANDVILCMNRDENDGHWIGVRLGGNPFGARITVRYKDGQQTGVYVAGDSHSAQHAPMKHFGLGKVDQVQAIEVRWPNGKTQRVDHPAVDRYHLIQSD